MFMFTTQEILGKNHKKVRNKPENKNYLLFSSVFKINFNDPKSNFFLVFDFGRFCVVIRFFIPPQRPMTSDFKGFLYQILSITSFSYLNYWERVTI